MKKFTASVLALICVLGLAGCNSSESGSDISGNTAEEIQENEHPSETQKPQKQGTDEKESATVVPLPVPANILNSEDYTAAISLEKGDFYRDENGTVMMDVTVFVYDLYDMADISLMKEGDTILRGQNVVLISSIERSESGHVLVNGGSDKGGFTLCAEDSIGYYECGSGGTKAYYAVGNVSLPVSPDFIYNDASDLNKAAVLFRAEDFLNDAVGIDYSFDAHNTTIQIEDGYVISMTRVYTP